MSITTNPVPAPAARPATRRSIRALALVVGLAAGVVPVLGTAAHAKGKSEAISMSRDEVADWCDEELGDVEYGTKADSGAYGCLSDGVGVINCETDDDCTFTPAKRASTPTVKGGTPSIDPGVLQGR